MRFFFKIFILGSAWLGWATSARAQAAEQRNLATDTLQPANASYHMPVTRLGTTTGQRLYVFLRESSNGQTNVLEFTWRHPLSLPRPKLVTIKLDQVQWLSTSGQYYEPVRLLGTKAQMLAWRRLAGPRVELFDIAWPKNKAISFVPLVGQAADLLARRDSADYNHYWFLRRPGQQYMTFVPTKKEFAAFLADYLVDAPALAAAIRASAAGHRYADVPQLLASYNKLAASPRESSKPNSDTGR
jgi:hypothetical protein